MTPRGAPITEEELHAYVDGLLPADRICAIEEYLASHPEAASRVAAWRLQVTKLRERFNPVLDEAVSNRFCVDTILSRSQSPWRKIAAAAVMALVVGVGAGWAARDLTPLGRNTDAARALAMAAIDAHRLFVGEVRHPVEVRADEAHLVPWLSHRVGSKLKAPDLQSEGLRLLGGRLLSRPSGAAALLMYQGAGGERITLTTTRSNYQGDEASFQWRSKDGVGAVAWLENGLAFVVAGPAERDRLDRIARSVCDAYEVAENDAGKKQ